MRERAGVQEVAAVQDGSGAAPLVDVQKTGEALAGELGALLARLLKGDARFTKT